MKSKILTAGLIAAMMVPAMAQAQTRELARDRQDIRQEQRDLNHAKRYGDRHDVRDAHRDVRDAKRGMRRFGAMPTAALASVRTPGVWVARLTSRGAIDAARAHQYISPNA